jgi:hypothetical protein
MKAFEFDNAHQGFPKLLDYVRLNGVERPSRGGSMYEVEDVTVSFPAGPRYEVPVRKGSAPLIGYMEGAQLVGAFEANDVMKKLWPKYFDFSDGYGNYGARMSNSDQLAWVFSELKDNPDTRRAVVTMWDPSMDVPPSHMDHPCTIGIIFRVRDGYLNMTVTMRSQDLILGHGPDIIQFGMLQQTFATALELECGTYTHHMISCHIYERDIPQACRFLNELDVTQIRAKYHDEPQTIAPLSCPGWTFEQIQNEAKKSLTLSENGDKLDLEFGTPLGFSIHSKAHLRLLNIALKDIRK